METKRIRIGLKTLATTFTLFAFINSASGQSMFKRNVDACFQRSYTKDHLKKHPNQTVTFIQVKHNVAENTQLIEGYNDLSKSISEILIDVSVRFRNDSTIYSNGLVCYGDSESCGVECDGGQAAFKRNASGDLMLDVRKTGGFVVLGGCDGESDEKSRFVGFASDDKLFKLFEVDMTKCLAADS